jgi:hypothetical protein
MTRGHDRVAEKMFEVKICRITLQNYITEIMKFCKILAEFRKMMLKFCLHDKFLENFLHFAKFCVIKFDGFPGACLCLEEDP